MESAAVPDRRVGRMDAWYVAHQIVLIATVVFIVVAWRVILPSFYLLAMMPFLFLNALFQEALEKYVKARGRIWLGKPDFSRFLIILPVFGWVYYVRHLRRADGKDLSLKRYQRLVEDIFYVLVSFVSLFWLAALLLPLSGNARPPFLEEGPAILAFFITIFVVIRTVDLVQRGYTGIEARQDVLWLNPSLPKELARLQLKIHYPLT